VVGASVGAIVVGAGAASVAFAAGAGASVVVSLSSAGAMGIMVAFIQTALPAGSMVARPVGLASTASVMTLVTGSAGGLVGAGGDMGAS